MEEILTAVEIEKLFDEKKYQIRELTLKHGLSYPSDAELIMLILGSGIKGMPVSELARRVLCIVMSSNDNDLLKNLMTIKGMGQSKALMIAAALEFGKRINRTPDVFLETPTAVIPFIQNYSMQKKEHFLCVNLNGAGEILSIRVLCTGSGNMAILKPAEVFESAIKEHASSVIIAHNHPSGTCFPSTIDIKTTLRISAAAGVLGIDFLDHIILTKADYFSFSEHKYLEPKKLAILLKEKEAEERRKANKTMEKNLEEDFDLAVADFLENVMKKQL